MAEADGQDGFSPGWVDERSACIRTRPAGLNARPVSLLPVSLFLAQSALLAENHIHQLPFHPP